VVVVIAISTPVELVVATLELVLLALLVLAVAAPT
jgi:hypothetical protein